MGLTVFGDIRLADGAQADRFDGNLNVKGDLDALNISVEGNIHSRFGDAILAGRLKSSAVDIAKRPEDPERFPRPEIWPDSGKEVLVHGNLDALNISVEGNIHSRFGDAILKAALRVALWTSPSVRRTLERFPRPKICARFGKDVLVLGMIETLHMRANGNISANGNVNAQTGTVNTQHLRATGNITATGTVSAANITLPNADCAEEFQVDATAEDLCSPARLWCSLMKVGLVPAGLLMTAAWPVSSPVVEGTSRASFSTGTATTRTESLSP